jgi:cytochrome c oxidase cbb3-type subunit 3
VNKKERDVVLGHEDEADGIQEYDNPLPDWWLGLFWITIIWGLGYLIHYHFIADRSPQAALAQEIAAAEERWPEGLTGAGVGSFEVTDAAVAAGEQVFRTNCVACHGINLEGGIGPNLLDDEWIHGGTSEDIINVVTNGVVEKGMLAWAPIIGAEAVNNVTAYVLSRNADPSVTAAPAPAEQAPAAAQVAGADFVITAAAVTAGEGIFAQFCIACHGSNLEGGIGPSFLDDEWIHGGTSADVIRIVTNGVPEKGMVAWGPVLGAEGVNNVAAYVMTKNSEALGREPGT